MGLILFPNPKKEKKREMHIAGGTHEGIETHTALLVHMRGIGIL